MSNKKLLVDLSKSILPTSFLPNSIKYQQISNGTIFNNGSKLLNNFSSPRSSRSSCSTCSTSCTSTSATTNSTYTTTATSNNNNTSSSSNSSSIISLNLSSSTTHTCDSSSDCNSNCSKLHTNSNSLSSSSILTTSISINSSVSESSSSSSSYFSTDEHPDTLFDEDDNNNNKTSKNSINNSYVCNSSDSSATATTTNSMRTNPSTITKITRSTSNLLNISKSNNNNTTNPTSVETVAKVNCMWNKCKFIGNATDVDDSLVEHIKSKHIFNQKCLKTFRCMWKGCSVFKKSSCSFNWLERHVIDHIDTKPFLCIFNGCKRKFRTEAARERHVQCHINSSENGSQPNSPIKTRNHLLFKSAQNLIQNIKNKNENLKLNDNTPALITNAAAKLSDIKINNTSINDKTKINELPDYTQILKALTKKRKVLTSETVGGKKFIKAQFKDFIDECSLSVFDYNLKSLNYQSGEILLKARVIGTKPKTENNKNEMLLVEWIPNNM